MSMYENKLKIKYFYVFLVVENSGKIRDGQSGNGGSCGLSRIAHLILIKIL